MSSTEDRVQAIVGPVLEPQGLALEDLQIRQAGQRRVVKITVDVDLAALELGDDTTPVSPLTLDEVADATRLIDDALEASDALGSSPYTLEVGSPGLSRPLTAPRHYRRNVGRLVKVALADGGQVTGRILRASLADDGEVELLVPATRGKNKQPEHHETHPYAALRSASVQVEFNRPGAAAIDLTDLPDDAGTADDDTDDTHDTEEN